MDKEDRELLIRVDERTRAIHEAIQPIVKKVHRHEQIIWLIVLVSGAVGATLLSMVDGIGSALLR